MDKYVDVKVAGILNQFSIDISLRYMLAMDARYYGWMELKGNKQHILI